MGYKKVFSGVVKEPLRYRWNINDHKYVRGKEKILSLVCPSSHVKGGEVGRNVQEKVFQG